MLIIKSVFNALRVGVFFASFLYLLTPASAVEKEVKVNLTQKQTAAIAATFKVEDCALWRGGAGHENDNVPKVYSEHVEAIFEFLDNLPLSEAMQAIELYCSSKGFDSKLVAQ
jgi:hypothetical protein